MGSKLKEWRTGGYLPLPPRSRLAVTSVIHRKDMNDILRFMSFIPVYVIIDSVIFIDWIFIEDVLWLITYECWLIHTWHSSFNVISSNMSFTRDILRSFLDVECHSHVTFFVQRHFLEDSPICHHWHIGFTNMSSLTTWFSLMTFTDWSHMNVCSSTRDIPHSMSCIARCDHWQWVNQRISSMNIQSIHITLSMIIYTGMNDIGRGISLVNHHVWMTRHLYVMNQWISSMITRSSTRDILHSILFIPVCYDHWQLEWPGIHMWRMTRSSICDQSIFIFDQSMNIINEYSINKYHAVNDHIHWNGEVGGWGRDPKKCTGRGWGMGSSTI